jgi:hypothetical protein
MIVLLNSCYEAMMRMTKITCRHSFVEGAADDENRGEIICKCLLYNIHDCKLIEPVHYNCTPKSWHY